MRRRGGRERRPALASLLGLVVLAALTGCGSDGTSSDRASPKAPEQLSAGEQSDVRELQIAVSSYCRKLGLYALRRGSPPGASDLERVDARLQELISLGREKPAAMTPGQRTIRESIGDVLEDVEGSNCSGPIEQRLGQALTSLPPP